MRVELEDGHVDLARRTVTRDDATVALTPNEARLFAYLAHRPGLPVTRQELLRDVWGYAPRTESHTVESTIRRLRQKIERDPTAPRHLLSMYGVGYRFETSTAPSGQPPLEPATAAALPPEPTSFVGRDADLDRLDACIAAGGRLVTLLGPAGVGKTRLSRRFGASRGGAFPGGVWFCDLAPTRSLETLVGAVAAATGVHLDGDHHTTATRIGARMGTRGRTLVILDNLEQVVTPAASVVGSWLAASPETIWLGTSRERLRVPGEVCLDLEPLPLADACRLFVERARAVAPVFEAADPALLEEIVGRLDGVPLAVELAAARMNALGLRDLRDRLNARFRLLSTPLRGVPDRHATLWQALAWSWDLLLQHERAALAQCSLFVGSFPVAAAESVLDLSHQPDAPWTLDVLAALRDKSLLRTVFLEALPGEARYQLTESIRDFAAEKLGDSRGAAETRHAEWRVADVERWAALTTTRRGVEATRRLEADLHDVLAVWQRFRETRPDLAARAVFGLLPLFRLRGPFLDHLTLLREVANATRTGAPALYARALLGCAGLATLCGLHDECESQAREALTCTEAPDERLEGHLQIASALSQKGGFAEAAAHLDQALALAEAAGGMARANVEVHLGHLAGTRRDFTASEAHWRAALDLFRQAGHVRGVIQTVANLGALYFNMDRVDEAVVYCHHGLELLRDVGGERNRAILVSNLARARLAQGRLDEARLLADEAIAITTAIGWVPLELATRATRAIAMQETGLWEQVLPEWIALADRAGDGAHRRLELTCRMWLGSLWHESGRLDLARDSYERAVALSDPHRPLYHADLLGRIAAVDADDDRLDAAREGLAAARVAAASHPDARRLFALHAAHLSLAEGRADPTIGPERRAAATEALGLATLADERGNPSNRLFDLRLAARLLARALAQSQ
jgi:predicted ATPase/DNA-binding winged helix-turn-helix (wHTH) protein